MSSETERPDASASQDANTPSAGAADGESNAPSPAASEGGRSETSETSASGDPGITETDGPKTPNSATEDSADTDTGNAGTGNAGTDDAGTDDAEGTGSDNTAGSDATGSGPKPPDTADRYNVESEDTRRSPALIATAVALPIALIVAVLVIAVIARQHPARQPLALASVPQPQATGPACTGLLPALPSSVGPYTRAQLAQPAPPATVAWQLPDGGDAVVLRCGLERPEEFIKSAALQVIDGVNWFEVRDPQSGVSSGTWYVVDRGTYIAVTMPDKAGPTPLQDISNTVGKVLPARPIDPGPIPN